jgi:hypothetical protein
MSRRFVSVLAVVALMLLAIVPAYAKPSYPLADYPFAGPIFGLDVAPDGSLLVADAGAGIVEMRKGSASLIAELPGVADVAAIGVGNMFAVTGAGEEGDPTASRLYRASRGNVREIANLGAFEAEVNPDGDFIDSNPFAVAALNGGQALVADAAGNSLLIVDQRGNVDWVATFPIEVVSTANLKDLLGCPDAPPELAWACGFPPMFPAEAVPTSIAIGPDGAYYVGELKGFPGPLGESRIWRIEPGTRHAECGSSPACTVVADGFTSIVDLAFGPDGTLYVVEIDEASFLAAELPMFGLPPATMGGTVSACTPGSWSCTEIATDLMLPTSIAVSRDGTVYVGSLLGQLIALP